MRVRELIRALAQHDLDLEVVMPFGSDTPAHFRLVAAVEQDIFAPDRREADDLVRAKLQDEDALIAVRLGGRPLSRSH